jgi:peptidoglycan/LPS O-acetylase OafA/YrhL
MAVALPDPQSQAVVWQFAGSADETRHNNLDAARLFLALNVAIGHGCHYWFGFDYRFGMAVSMFLGISGYLVLESRYKSASAAHFIWKRFLRIYPLMIATIVIGSLWFGRPMWPVVVYLVTAGLRGDSMIGPGWTIIVEEVMYGLLLVLYFDVSQNIQRIIILPANFFFGNVLYIHRHSLARYYRFATVPCALVGFGYMLSSFPVTVGTPHTVLAFHVLAQFMGIVACIGFGLHAPPLFGWLRKMVGDLSYSVYLVHSLLLSWFLPHPLSSNRLTFTAFIGSSLLLGFLSWRLIEKPSLGLRDLPRTAHWFPGTRERSPSQLSGCTS